MGTNDQFINKLIARMAEIFATKNDLERIEQHITRVEQNLTNEIKSVGETLSEYAHGLDDKVENHEKRLKKIESIPSIAHQIK